MLLEAIFERIKYHEGRRTDRDITDIERLASVLREAIPEKYDVPDHIIIDWYSDSENILYKFAYIDERKNRTMKFDELYQYFCTVLGEEKK